MIASAFDPRQKLPIDSDALSPEEKRPLKGGGSVDDGEEQGTPDLMKRKKSKANRPEMFKRRAGAPMEFSRKESRLSRLVTSSRACARIANLWNRFLIPKVIAVILKTCNAEDEEQRQCVDF